MGSLITFINWLKDRINWSIVLMVTPLGAVVGGVSAAVGFVSSLFSRFTLFNDFGSVVSSFSQSLSSLVIDNVGAIVGYCLYTVAIDRLCEIGALVVSATVGLTVLIFITIFLALVALLPLQFTIRATLKGIQVLTAGFVQP